MATTLNLTEIRTAFDSAIDSVSALLGDVVGFDGSMYWIIESVEAFEMSNAPSLNLGSLTDDDEHVRELYEETRDDSQVTPWHDLDHLIGVMTRLSAAIRR